MKKTASKMLGRGVGRGRMKAVPTVSATPLSVRREVVKKAVAVPGVALPEVDESFELRPPSPNRKVAFAMTIKLSDALKEVLNNAELEGIQPEIKFGIDNVIRVGSMEFKLTSNPEAGTGLCDCYMDEQLRADGVDGVLSHVGSVARKLSVQRLLDDSEKAKWKQRSEEVDKSQKGRKVMVFDPKNPGLDASQAQLNKKRKITMIPSAPPAVRPKVMPIAKPIPRTVPAPRPPSIQPAQKPMREPSSSVAASTVPSPPIRAASPTAPPPSSAPTPIPSTVPASISAPIPTTARAPSPAASVRATGKEKAVSPRSGANSPAEGGAGQVRKASLLPPISAVELRAQLLKILSENPRGMKPKALEKAMGREFHQMERVVKQIAEYKAPGLWRLSQNSQQGSAPKTSTTNASSPDSVVESPPLAAESPAVQITTTPEKAPKPVLNLSLKVHGADLSKLPTPRFANVDNGVDNGKGVLDGKVKSNREAKESEKDGVPQKQAADVFGKASPTGGRGKEGRQGGRVLPPSEQGKKTVERPKDDGQSGGEKPKQVRSSSKQQSVELQQKSPEGPVNVQSLQNGIVAGEEKTVRDESVNESASSGGSGSESESESGSESGSESSESGSGSDSESEGSSSSSGEEEDEVDVDIDIDSDGEGGGGKGKGREGKAALLSQSTDMKLSHEVKAQSAEVKLPRSDSRDARSGEGGREGKKEKKEGEKARHKHKEPFNRVENNEVIEARHVDIREEDSISGKSGDKMELPEIKQGQGIEDRSGFEIIGLGMMDEGTEMDQVGTGLGIPGGSSCMKENVKDESVELIAETMQASIRKETHREKRRAERGPGSERAEKREKVDRGDATEGLEMVEKVERSKSIKKGEREHKRKERHVGQEAEKKKGRENHAGRVHGKDKLQVLPESRKVDLDDSETMADDFMQDELLSPLVEENRGEPEKGTARELKTVSIESDSLEGRKPAHESMEEAETGSRVMEVERQPVESQRESDGERKIEVIEEGSQGKEGGIGRNEVERKEVDFEQSEHQTEGMEEEREEGELDADVEMEQQLERQEDGEEAVEGHRAKVTIMDETKDARQEIEHGRIAEIEMAFSEDHGEEEQKERVKREWEEQERLAKEHKELEREKERVEKERQERERRDREQRERERERKEKEREDRERRDRERKEKEREEKEKLERERKEREDRERKEKEREEKEKLERERKEREDRERRERDKKEREREEKEKLERERKEREENEKMERERKEEREARERKERDRKEKEREEKERKAKARVEKERKERERNEKFRKEKEREEERLRMREELEKASESDRRVEALIESPEEGEERDEGEAEEQEDGVQVSMGKETGFERGPVGTKSKEEREKREKVQGSSGIDQEGEVVRGAQKTEGGRQTEGERSIMDREDVEMGDAVPSTAKVGVKRAREEVAGMSGKAGQRRYAGDVGRPTNWKQSPVPSVAVGILTNHTSPTVPPVVGGSSTSLSAESLSEGAELREALGGERGRPIKEVASRDGKQEVRGEGLSRAERAKGESPPIKKVGERNSKGGDRNTNRIDASGEGARAKAKGMQTGLFSTKEKESGNQGENGNGFENEHSGSARRGSTSQAANLNNSKEDVGARKKGQPGKPNPQAGDLRNVVKATKVAIVENGVGKNGVVVGMKGKGEVGQVKTQGGRAKVQKEMKDEFFAKFEKERAEVKGPVENLAQCLEYEKEFREKFRVYSVLNSVLESDREDFSNLETELQKEEDEDKRESLKVKLKRKYRQMNPRHSRMLAVFKILHTELQAIKRRLTDFARKHEQS